MINKILRGDIYYADLSGCSGSEQGGYRPVIVIQNDVGNKYSPTTLIAPLTSKLTKRDLPTHVSLRAYECGLKCDSIVLLEQIRVIDKERLKGYISCLDEDKLYEIDNAIAISFGLVSRVVA